MSGMFGRFTNIVKAKMHRAMSEAEDPAEMLDYSFEKQMEMLQKVRSGISEEMGDVQLAMQRAQDKTEQMQARATALEELVGTSALPEIGPGSGDDIDRELARLTAGDEVERQLDAMKRQLPGGPEAPKQLESGDAPPHG